MQDGSESGVTGWNLEASQTFLDYGRYFVPDRDVQMQMIRDLIPEREQLFHVIDLCCGEGLLSHAILARFSSAVAHGLDGAPEMLQRAREHLVQFGDRFIPQQIELADRTWRRPSYPVQAVVSSLAIHHLDGAGKQALFRDVYNMLNHGGAVIIADVIQPTTERGWAVAAAAWDQAVRQRAFELDGNTEAAAIFEREHWNMYRYFDPADIDRPSSLFDQLQWLAAAGFTGVDVYWMRAGHAIFGGYKD